MMSLRGLPWEARMGILAAELRKGGGSEPLWPEPQLEAIAKAIHNGLGSGWSYSYTHTAREYEDVSPGLKRMLMTAAEVVAAVIHVPTPPPDRIDVLEQELARLAERIQVLEADLRRRQDDPSLVSRRVRR